MSHYRNRFWYPKNSSVYLADNGYLYDPEGEMGKYYNATLKRLSSLHDIGCLILLGESGSGKTTEMIEERRRLLGQEDIGSDQVIWIDLDQFQCENRLCDAVLKWMKADYPLYLFLDSYDECILRIETLSALLLSKLTGLPIERLYLRIACKCISSPAN